MVALWKCLWTWLGHIFRLKTIGDLLGWWDTEAWQRVIAVGGAAVLGFVSNYLHAPIWALPIISLIAFSLLVLLISKINRAQPNPTLDTNKPDADPVPRREARAETHAPHSPAFATAGDNSPINYHEKPPARDITDEQFPDLVKRLCFLNGSKLVFWICNADPETSRFGGKLNHAIQEARIDCDFSPFNNLMGGDPEDGLFIQYNRGCESDARRIAQALIDSGVLDGDGITLKRVPSETPYRVMLRLWPRP